MRVDLGWAAMLAAAAVTLAVPTAALAQQGPATAYRINPGDELEISVFGEERLQRAVRVLPDGSAAFPLVGQIRAANRLPSELERIIAEALKPQYSGVVPQVTVAVRNPAGLQFSVVGKVRAPGTFTPGRYINALEALALAGGPTEFAQLGDVIVLRKVGGDLRAIRVRLGNVLRGNPSSADLSASGVPQLQGGDTLVIP